MTDKQLKRKIRENFCGLEDLIMDHDLYEFYIDLIYEFIHDANKEIENLNKKCNELSIQIDKLTGMVI